MSADTVNKLEADSYHWQRLSQLHPTDVCNRTEAIYNPSREGFVLPVYQTRYLILPKQKEILRVEPNDKPVKEDLHPYFVLMVLVYLVEAKDLKPTHTWISEKDLQGGSTFFRGLHRLEVEALEDRFGKDPEAFLRAGSRLGGNEILYGDRGFALAVFPKIPLAYVLWKGDEEFPPRIGVLFDSSIQSHLALDLIWCMVSETTRRLLEVSER
jgi:hypothetical protein